MNVYHHPANGLGDLLGGWFVVPQNPIRDAGTPMVPSVQGQYPNMVAYRPKLGDLLRASFVVPQNPLWPTPGAMSKAGSKGMGCGCGCNGANFYGMSGLGQSFSDVISDVTAGQWSSAGSDFTSWLGESSIISALPNWSILAGGAVALMLIMPGGSEYRAKSRALRSQYRGYKRLAKSVQNPRRRNIAAGYYDEDGYFHPIRASYDYSAARAGETPKKAKRRKR